MTDLVQGAYVRHKAKPEWGLGLIEAVTDQDLQVRFENHSDPKWLRRDRVAGKLEVIPQGEVPESHRLRTRSARGRKPPSGAAPQCSACGDRLKKSRFSSDRQWKSCPRCSDRHGAEHVYRRYPDDFGTSAARENESNPEGWQSHCVGCRSTAPPELTGPNGRLCSEVH